MTSGCPVKELCEETTCPICLEYFRDPVILDCGHNFCRACLTQHWKGFGMAVSCPQCREKDQKRSVRPNRQLANVVELVKKLQKGEEAEGTWRMCERHQEPLKLYCEDDQAPICVVCDRSKEHRTHTVVPIEEASQEHEGIWSEAGAQNMAVRYLMMEESQLLEHCQKQGLRSKGLSVEDLRIQHASQPAPEVAKGRAEKIRAQQLEQDDCEPNGREPCQAQERMPKEQVAAQAQQQKREWELLQKKQPDKNAPKSFTPFSPGGSPTGFLSNFERAAQKQKVTVEEYMMYLPTLLRGELADFYQNLPERGSVTYPVFREAVSKHFHPGPDHFCKEFYTLRPQEGRSFLEFGAKLEEALNSWLDSAKADNREKVLDVIVLDQFFFQLPPDIRPLVKAQGPQDVFQAAAVADQLMLNWEGPVRGTPNSRRDGKGSQKGGWEEAHAKREKRYLSVEPKRAPNVAVSAHLKEKVCFKCGETGHFKATCPKMAASTCPKMAASTCPKMAASTCPKMAASTCLKMAASTCPKMAASTCPKMAASTCLKMAASTCKPVYYVTAFFEVGKEATTGIREAVVVRDRQVVGVVSSGSDVSVICADLVSPSDIVPGETFLIQFLTGRSTVQVAHLPIRWRGKTSLFKVGVVEGLVVPMIIGRDVLHRDGQSFVITPRQWAEWEATHTEGEFQPISRSDFEQISSGRPAATAEMSTDSRKGGNWALRETLEKAELPAEQNWPTSSREEENGDLRRQRGGLRIVPGCQRLGLV